MLGDVMGRKRMFALTIILMAIPTLLIGILPTYAQVGVIAPFLLLICRMAQGLSLGGEIPGAAVFVGEHVPYKRLGFACSLVGTGAALGIFARRIHRRDYDVNDRHARDGLMGMAGRLHYRRRAGIDCWVCSALCEGNPGLSKHAEAAQARDRACRSPGCL